MTYLFDEDKNFFGLDGRLLAYGKVYFCTPDGTANINTLKTIYTTHAMGVTASNPQTLTATGRFAQEVHGTGLYDIVIKTSALATVRTLYNVPAHYAADALSVTFTPSSGAAETNLQTFLRAIYARTVAETAASVTPTNYYAMPGDIVRYGAVIDGATDDYLAFNKALLSNGRVFSSKAGTCLIGTSIAMADNTELDLAGLKLIASVKDWASTGIVRVVSKSNCVIRGGWLDGQKGSNSTGRGFGVDIRGGTNVRVESVRATNFPGLNSGGQQGGDGIYVGMDGSTVPENIVITGCILDGNVRQGASIVQADGVTVQGNHFLNSTGDNPGGGLDLEANNTGETLRQITVTGNVFDGNYYGFIATTAATNVTVSGNSFRNNRFHDAYIADCDNLTFTGNTVVSSGKSASSNLININSANSVVIANNVLIGSGTDAEEGSAIAVVNGNYVRIASNVIRLSRTHGVAIGNSAISAAFTDVDVENNMFIDCVDSASTGTPVIAVAGNTTGSLWPYRVNIRNNHIYDSRSAGNECDNAISISTNITASVRADYRVEGNTISGPALQFVANTYPPLALSFNWNPGNLVDGAGETSSGQTVTGAAVGDLVEVYPPYDLQDIVCTGYVSATDTVEVRLQNESGGAVDLANGAWRVRVRKFYE